MNEEWSVETGLTLLELVVAVAIIAIVCGASLPTIKEQLVIYQLRGTAREIYGAFQVARQEAVRRRSNCVLSFGGIVAGNAADCHVYVDLDSNSVWDPGEEVLLSMSCPSSRGVFFGGANFSNNFNGQPTLGYTPKGLTVSPVGGFGAGTVFVRNERGHILRVIVNAVGRVRIAKN